MILYLCCGKERKQEKEDLDPLEYVHHNIPQNMWILDYGLFSILIILNEKKSVILLETPGSDAATSVTTPCQVN